MLISALEILEHLLFFMSPALKSFTVPEKNCMFEQKINIYLYILYICSSDNYPDWVYIVF